MRRLRAKVDAEIEFHIDARTDELVAGGISRAAARAQALREFGDVAQACEELATIDARIARRALRRRRWLGLVHDARFAVRTLVKAPWSLGVAVGGLAVAIGVAAVVVAVAKATLVDPLPYADSDRLVLIDAAHPRDGSALPLTAAMVENLRGALFAFESAAAYRSRSTQVVVGGAAASTVTVAAWAEPELFGVLGVEPAMGTGFGATGVRRAEVVLTHMAWRSFLPGIPDPVGHPLIVDGVAHTVVGVLPPDFVSPTGYLGLFLPLDIGSATAGGARDFRLIGRLHRGATLADGQADLDRAVAELARRVPDTSLSPLASESLRVAMVGPRRTPLLALLVAALCVLLASAALSSHPVARDGVHKVAGWRRARRLWVECALLASIAGFAGVALGAAALEWLRAVCTPVVPTFTYVTLGADLLDSKLIAIVVGLTLMAGAVMTGATAWRVRRWYVS